MTLHQEDDIVTWFDSPEDLKPDYIPVKCWSVLQFYQLKGKTTKLTIDNLEGIKYVYYLLYSPQEKRYYKKFWRNYSAEVYYFYRRTNTFSGEDISVENLRRWIEDGNVTILFTQPQIDATREMLQRLYKAHFGAEGKMDYKLFIELLRLSLDYEDYMDKCKNVTGYKTVCRQYDDQIADVSLKLKNKPK